MWSRAEAGAQAPLVPNCCESGFFLEQAERLPIHCLELLRTHMLLWEDTRVQGLKGK